MLARNTEFSAGAEIQSIRVPPLRISALTFAMAMVSYPTVILTRAYPRLRQLQKRVEVTTLSRSISLDLRQVLQLPQPRPRPQPPPHRRLPIPMLAATSILTAIVLSLPDQRPIPTLILKFVRRSAHLKDIPMLGPSTANNASVVIASTRVRLSPQIQTAPKFAMEIVSTHLSVYVLLTYGFAFKLKRTAVTHIGYPSTNSVHLRQPRLRLPQQLQLPQHLPLPHHTRISAAMQTLTRLEFFRLDQARRRPSLLSPAQRSVRPKGTPTPAQSTGSNAGAGTPCHQARQAHLRLTVRRFAQETVSVSSTGTSRGKLTSSFPASETCGNSYRIQIYQLAITSTPSTTTTAATSTATSSYTYTYLGCYDDATTNRVLSDGPDTSSSLTTESCMASCASRGYAYGGTEYGEECWCGTMVASDATAASSSDCSQACSGNCGCFCNLNVELNSALITLFDYSFRDMR